jgi:proline dehydrogenase
MKRKIGTVLSVFALMLMMSVGAPAEGRHPEIHRAIESLQNAKAHLEAAAHDYHGHRADAIHAIDEAIHQLQICMDFD